MYANLNAVDFARGRFVYRLQFPFKVYALDPDTDYFSNTFAITSDDEGCLTLWADRGHVVARTPVPISHAELLGNYRYYRLVHPGWVQSCSDDDILFCIETFEKTNDEVDMFYREFRRR